MSAAKFARGDLLIDPDTRWVIEDKGATWVTDRFVMVRGDLFKQLPSHAPAFTDKPLPKRRLRDVLAGARGPGSAIQHTDITYSTARMYTAGPVTIALNDRVTRTYYRANLRPRYIHPGTVAWYGTKRGRDVLMVVQRIVSPMSLRYSDLAAAS